MKIHGSIEINGIDRVVFYKKNCFVRVTRPNGQTYWYDTNRRKSLDNDTMCDIVKNATVNPVRKVWVHGNTINVDRYSKKYIRKIKNTQLSTKYIPLREILTVNY